MLEEKNGLGRPSPFFYVFLSIPLLHAVFLFSQIFGLFSRKTINVGTQISETQMSSAKWMSDIYPFLPSMKSALHAKGLDQVWMNTLQSFSLLTLSTCYALLFMTIAFAVFIFSRQTSRTLNRMSVMVINHIQQRREKNLPVGSPTKAFLFLSFILVLLMIFSFVMLFFNNLAAFYLISNEGQPVWAALREVLRAISSVISLEFLIIFFVYCLFLSQAGEIAESATNE